MYHCRVVVLKGMDYIQNEPPLNEDNARIPSPTRMKSFVIAR